MKYVRWTAAVLLGVTYLLAALLVLFRETGPF
jgi:hypothetical protein